MVKGTFSITSLAKPVLEVLWMVELVARGRVGFLQIIPFLGPIA